MRQIRKQLVKSEVYPEADPDKVYREGLQVGRREPEGMKDHKRSANPFIKCPILRVCFDLGYVHGSQQFSA